MSKEKSFDYFFDNKERLMRGNEGRYLVFRNGKFCGVYPDQLAVELNAYKYGGDLLVLYLGKDGVKEYQLQKLVIRK